MKIPLAVLADYVNVTVDGKLNIMGIFDRIFTLGFPAVHASMRLVVKIQFAPAERGSTKTIEIKLLDEDGGELVGLASTIAVPPDAPLNPEVPQILELNGIPFAKPGAYVFSILVNGEEKATVPFSVAQLPTPQGS